MITPWPALERNSALRAIPSVWREFMGGHFETFQAAFFHKLPEPSQGFFCERCYCTHEVIIYGPEAHARALADIGHGSASLRVSEFQSLRVSIFATCRCEDRHCPDIPLIPADLEVWALNWPKLGRALCQAFGLNSRFADLN